ncbi:UNVERIFIED_CONTAM: hypothetical protein HDU68_010950 [Siphonaria sp. JEL0065]|nr:hypothetical protein HDU68_010950 [Siphonaria sp. JEL0065]
MRHALPPKPTQTQAPNPAKNTPDSLAAPSTPKTTSNQVKSEKTPLLHALPPPPPKPAHSQSIQSNKITQKQQVPSLVAPVSFNLDSHPSQPTLSTPTQPASLPHKPIPLPPKPSFLPKQSIRKSKFDQKSKVFRILPPTGQDNDTNQAPPILDPNVTYIPPARKKSSFCGPYVHSIFRIPKFTAKKTPILKHEPGDPLIDSDDEDDDDQGDEKERMSSNFDYFHPPSGTQIPPPDTFPKPKNHLFRFMSMHKNPDCTENRSKLMKSFMHGELTHREKLAMGYATVKYLENVLGITASKENLDAVLAGKEYHAEKSEFHINKQKLIQYVMENSGVNRAYNQIYYWLFMRLGNKVVGELDGTPWTTDQDIRLLELAPLYGFDWIKSIAPAMGRSGFNCSDRYEFLITRGEYKGYWKPTEINEFLNLLLRYDRPIDDDALYLEKPPRSIMAKIGSKHSTRDYKDCLTKWKYGMRRAFILARQQLMETGTVKKRLLLDDTPHYFSKEVHLIMLNCIKQANSHDETEIRWADFPELKKWTPTDLSSEFRRIKLHVPYARLHRLGELQNCIDYCLQHYDSLQIRFLSKPLLSMRPDVVGGPVPVFEVMDSVRVKCGVFELWERNRERIEREEKEEEELARGNKRRGRKVVQASGFEKGEEEYGESNDEEEDEEELEWEEVAIELTDDEDDVDVKAAEEVSDEEIIVPASSGSSTTKKAAKAFITSKETISDSDTEEPMGHNAKKIKRKQASDGEPDLVESSQKEKKKKKKRVAVKVE